VRAMWLRWHTPCLLGGRGGYPGGDLEEHAHADAKGYRAVGGEGGGGRLHAEGGFGDDERTHLRGSWRVSCGNVGQEVQGQLVRTSNNTEQSLNGEWAVAMQALPHNEGALQPPVVGRDGHHNASETILLHFGQPERDGVAGPRPRNAREFDEGGRRCGGLGRHRPLQEVKGQVRN